MGRHDDDDDEDARPPMKAAPPSPEQVRLVATIIFGIVGLVFLLNTFRVEEVRADQIGYLLNNWTGEISEVREAGNVVFCGLWNDFYSIENKNLSIDMGATAGEDDYVKLKTLDGNDVFVDFTIFYTIDPQKARTILLENGPGAAYQRLWVRDYGRAIIRYVFGELTTEAFYVAEERDQRTRAAEKEMNGTLERHGIHVTQIAVQSFRYLPDYEKKIQEKKIADQEVEQWRSTRAANEQGQQRRILQAQQEAENTLTRFQGELDQKVEEAKGQAEKLKRQADAYSARVKPAAEANFQKAQAEAEGAKARLTAEAAGVRALRDAMAGDGGRNIVAMEYAKKLAGVKVTGRPFVLEGEVRRFAHENVPGPRAAGAAAASEKKGGGQ